MLKHIDASREQFEKAKKWAVAGRGLTSGPPILSFTVIAEGGFRCSTARRWRVRVPLLFGAHVRSD